MANLKNSAKAARQSEIRRARNTHYKSTMRGKVKAVRAAIESGDAAAAQAALKDATSYIDHVATKGVLHPKTASRKVSRLAHAVSGL